MSTFIGNIGVPRIDRHIRYDYDVGAALDSFFGSSNPVPAAVPQQNFIPPPAPTVGPLVSNAPPPVAATPQQFQQPFIAPVVSQLWSQPWSQPVLPAQFSLQTPVPGYATPQQMGMDIFGAQPPAATTVETPPTALEAVGLGLQGATDIGVSVVAPGADNMLTAYQRDLPQADVDKFGNRLVDPNFVPAESPGGPQDFVAQVSELNGPGVYKGVPLTESFSTLKSIVEGIQPLPTAAGGAYNTAGGASFKKYEEYSGKIANAVATGNIDDALIRDLKISANTLVEAHKRYAGVLDAEKLKIDTPALPPPAEALAATVETVSADDAMRSVPSTPGGLSTAPKTDPAVRLVEELYTAGVEATGTPLSDEAKKDLYARTVDRVKVDEVYKPRLAAVEERLGGLDKTDPLYAVLAKEKERLETRIGAIEEKYKTTVAPVDKEAEHAAEFLTDGEKYIAARTGTLTGSDATQWNYYQDKVKDLELWREADDWSRSKDASEGKDPPTRLASQFRNGQLVKQPELPATEATIVGRVETERRIFESLHETTRADLLRRPGDMNLDSLVQARQEQQLEPFKLAFGGASDPIMAGGLSDVLDDAGLEALNNAEDLLRKGQLSAADRAFQQVGRLAIRSQFERAASGKGVIVGGDGSLTVDPRMLSEAQQLQATLGEMFDAAPEGSPARVAIRSQMLRLDRGIDGATGKSEHITGLGLSDFYAKLQADMDVNTPKGATKEYAGHLGEVGETIKERAQLTIKGAIATFERSQGLERDKQTLRETIDGAIDLGRREFKNYVNSTRHGTEFGREGVTRKVRNDGSVEWNTANILAVGNLALLALAPLERAYWQKRQEKREDERYDEDWERLKEQMALQNDYRLQQIGAAGEASRGGGSVAAVRPARF
jgi:hypothetical protein